jgi:glycosyltransferase involved in cell wall biosynthesis
MISVIVPLYNKSLHIEKCLQSVFNQTFIEFEVIVINDGSTDDGLERVQKISLANPFRLQIISQQNLGVSAARNNGVKAAKYDLIAFLDADDWWEPTYLAEMKSLIEAFPKAVIYGSGYRLVKNGVSRIADIAIEPTFNMGLINYFKVYSRNLCMPLWTCSVVIRKSIYEAEKGFKPYLKLGEDFDLWVRVALKYPVAFLNKPLANYNQDVAKENRAVGNLHQPVNHMLWNLGYLEKEEQSNPDLKLLLDKLRLYNLFPYYISNRYHLDAKAELAKVDWHLCRSTDKLKYSLPIWVLKIWNHFMIMGSGLKQKMIRMAIKFKK